MSLPALRSQELADAFNASDFRMHDDSDRSMPVDVAQMSRWSREIGNFRVWWKDVKVEVFTPRVPLQDAVLTRRIQVQLEGAGAGHRRRSWGFGEKKR
ncbi:MAG: hypothetical protein FD180_3055 [Planctomycetota bacterium]|nr:MAG: hypothetical protein FD180_3055 [Planctomycetota bacterium]